MCNIDSQETEVGTFVAAHAFLIPPPVFFPGFASDGLLSVYLRNAKNLFMPPPIDSVLASITD